MVLSSYRSAPAPSCGSWQRPGPGRFTPVMPKKFGNCWGGDITSDGELFFTQPTSGDLVMHVPVSARIMAEAGMGAQPSWQVMIHLRPVKPLMSWEEIVENQPNDVIGSFTAACGCAVYEGGAWPEEWNLGYFTAEPTVHILHHEQLHPALVDGKITAANDAPDKLAHLAGRHQGRPQPGWLYQPRDRRQPVPQECRRGDGSAPGSDRQPSGYRKILDAGGIRGPGSGTASRPDRLSPVRRVTVPPRLARRRGDRQRQPRGLPQQGHAIGSGWPQARWTHQ
jgi:hypothetical protein